MLNNALSEETRKEFSETFAKSENLLLCCDFDGTLVPFTDDPTETQLPEKRKNLLQQLANLSEVHLAVISGRDFDQLLQLVPIYNAILAGNHGLKLRWEDGTLHKPEISQKIEPTIEQIHTQLKDTFRDRNGVILENKGVGLTVHYRKYPGNPNQLKEDFYDIWENYQIPQLEVIEGAKLLEIRLASWNKGDALELIRDRLPAMPAIYVGDDTTDEDAFEVLRHQDKSFPILVGDQNKKNTKARLYLSNTDKVIELLSFIYQKECV